MVTRINITGTAQTDDAKSFARMVAEKFKRLYPDKQPGEADHFGGVFAGYYGKVWWDEGGSLNVEIHDQFEKKNNNGN